MATRPPVPTGRLRPIALGVVRRDDEILVFEGYDPSKAQSFFRPLGGGINFGERGVEALRREFAEELGVELDQPRYLGTLENIFVYDGRPGHEICLIFGVALRDRSLYERDQFEGREDDASPFLARWKPLADFRNGDRLYPDGLLDLLVDDAEPR
jgi:8-oxo-dGTP pyrophosphatase MutT (NUDIX family)